MMSKSNYSWQLTRIKDIGKVITGRTPPTEVVDYFGDEFPFITPSDMKGSKFISKPERGLSSKGATLLKNNSVLPKSIAVSCIGWQMGKVVMISQLSFTNQQINTIILNDGVEPDYIYYSLCTLRQELKNLGSVGTRTPILIKSTFENIQIPLPTLLTQRKIASILSAYDDLIENNTRRIAILEEMAQTLYSEWFVHFRFPGHEKKSMVESALGMIPEGWEVVKLGDIAGINRSSIKKGYEPAEINYVDITSVSTGQIDNIETIAFKDAPGRARRIVKHGDIIWSTVRPNRRSYSIIIDPPINLIVSTGFAVISTYQVPYAYLYYSLTTDDFVSYLANRATGSAYPAVSSIDFQNALVLLPSKAILTKFHNIVEDMLAEKQNHFQRNANLRQTRDLLLPKLISGEVDVERLEIAAVMDTREVEMKAVEV
jgi:type I restriction enzyme, S subunit